MLINFINYINYIKISADSVVGNTYGMPIHKSNSRHKMTTTSRKSGEDIVPSNDDLISKTSSK